MGWQNRQDTYLQDHECDEFGAIPNDDDQDCVEATPEHYAVGDWVIVDYPNYPDWHGRIGRVIERRAESAGGKPYVVDVEGPGQGFFSVSQLRPLELAVGDVVIIVTPGVPDWDERLGEIIKVRPHNFYLVRLHGRQAQPLGFGVDQLRFSSRPAGVACDANGRVILVNDIVERTGDPVHTRYRVLSVDFSGSSENQRVSVRVRREVGGAQSGVRYRPQRLVVVTS